MSGPDKPHDTQLAHVDEIQRKGVPRSIANHARTLETAVGGVEEFDLQGQVGPGLIFGEEAQVGFDLVGVDLIEPVEGLPPLAVDVESPGGFPSRQGLGEEYAPSRLGVGPGESRSLWR